MKSEVSIEQSMAPAHRLNAALVEHYLRSGYVLPAYRGVAAITIRALRRQICPG